MNCAVCARKSNEQSRVADEAKSVARQVEHARVCAEEGLERHRRAHLRRRRHFRRGVLRPTRLRASSDMMTSERWRQVRCSRRCGRTYATWPEV